MVSFVLTSNGRLNLLQKTIESFMKYNTNHIAEYILIDDSGKSKIHDEIRRLYPEWILILESHHGQVTNIDIAYSKVKTPYIFHCEDDWEFTRPGFIEQSMKILECNSKIIQVWLLQGNNHPVEPEVFKVGEIKYQLLGFIDGWYGFSFNPGLRRLIDYKQLAPYSQFGNTGYAEKIIGQKYFDLGFRSAILNDQYCHHIG